MPTQNPAESSNSRLPLIASPDCSTIHFRLTTVSFLPSNALAGPLVPGGPPRLLLLRLVTSLTLGLYWPASLLVTTVSPTAPLTKGPTIYSLGGPTTTLTASKNFHFIDDRSAGPNLVGVRQLDFVEVLEISVLLLT